MTLYLHRQDIQDLNKVSEKEALNIMREIRATYNLPKKRYISVRAYCQYFMVTKEDVYKLLSTAKRANASQGPSESKVSQLSATA